MKWVFSSIFGLIGVIFLVIGCPMLAGAAGLYFFLDFSTAGWPKVTGTVTGIYQSESYDSNTGSYTTLYCPTVQFITNEGETVEVDSNDCSSPSFYSTGDTIELYYTPGRPQNIQIEGGLRDVAGNVFVIIFMVLGVLFLLLGTGLAVFALVAALWRGREPAPASASDPKHLI